MKKTLFSLAVVLGCLAASTQAQIQVSSSGSGLISFDAQPLASEWSTRTIGGGGGDINDIDTLNQRVQTNSAALINTQLPSEPTSNPPLEHTRGYYSSGGAFIYTRSTSCGYSVLMANLTNVSGSSIPSFTVSYDFNTGNPSGTAEQVDAWRVYYSLTGLPDSWQPIPELSGITTAGAVSATVTLMANWEPNTMLYLLWADDNGNPGLDGWYSIDNFSLVSSSSSSVCNIISPANESSFPEGVRVTVMVSAALQGETVTSVDLNVDGTLYATKTSPPFSFVLSNLAVGGPYVLVAAANGSGGTYLSSDGVAINIIPNIPPTLTFSEPLDGAESLVGVLITNRVTASDSDGSVTRVEFYVDDQLRDSDTTSTYTFEYCSPTVGAHTIKAVAVDSSDARTTNSVTVNVTMPPGYSVIIPNGSTWKYFDLGIDPTNNGVAPHALGYDDSGWSNGVAEIGFGDLDAHRPEATVITNINFPGTTDRIAAFYFRKEFVVENLSALTNLVIRLMNDDGAIVYINGIEAMRHDYQGVDSYTNYTIHAVDGDGTLYNVTNVLPATVNLVQGTNLIAVEVHENSRTSSDLSFDLMLWGEGAAGPTLTIVNNQDGTVTLSWTGAGVLQESADLATWQDSTRTNPETFAVSGKMFYRLRP